jgi:tRNA threonylcarbamoyladenosine biosynthesis protein TsaE
VTLNEDELRSWGERIGAGAATPLFVTLSGDLGAGKSVLARAIARGAGVTAVMPSPTFNLVFRYEAARGIDVVHLDLYRLERVDDVAELGWRELGATHEIVLVEWPERAAQLLPRDRWDIRIDVAADDLRSVSASARGDVAPLPQPRPAGV